MVRHACSILIILSVLLFLGGCAGKAVVDTSRVEVARAESLVRAAELSGADELAAAEIAQARVDLELAQAYSEAPPQTGTLLGNLERKEELKQQAILNSRRALNSAELALMRVNEAKAGAELSPARINEIKNNARQELAAEVRQEVKEEVRADLEQNFKRKAPSLPPLKFTSIRGDLYRAIKNEFGPELAKWELAVDRQYLSVGFYGTATAFKSGSTWVNRKTRRVIEKFFPRFVKVLMRPEFVDRVKEIRVEGFSSTNYDSADTTEEKNHLNLLLSQERTANMIRFILLQPKLKNNQWLIDHLLPVGFDGRDPVISKGGVEDEVRSRRVEFRVILEKPPQGFR